MPKEVEQVVRLVGLPGFEPGSFPRKALVLALREPKSPSLDQTSRQPLQAMLNSLTMM